MTLHLSNFITFAAGRRRLYLYHTLNGAVIRVSEPIRRALEPLVPGIAAWALEDAGCPEADVEAARERLALWRFLVPPGHDEQGELLDLYPLRSPWSVFYVRDDRQVVRARYDAAREKPVLEMLTPLPAALWLACDGTHTLREIVVRAGDDAAVIFDLARSWTRHDRQHLKWLPRPIGELAANGGPPPEGSSDPLRHSAELLSHVKDLRPAGREPPPPARPDTIELTAYHRSEIRDAGEQFDVREATLSHLFRNPHPALGWRSYGQALGQALKARGLLSARTRRAVEVGGGTGAMAAALLGSLVAESPELARGLAYTIVDLAPALIRGQRERIASARGEGWPRVRWVEGSAERLPLRDASCDLIVSNEILADLTVERDPASGAYVNAGAVRFVEEVARVLAPGGAAVLTEYGELDAPVVPADGLDHAEHTIRYRALLERAQALGLRAELVPVGDLLGFDLTTPILFADDIHSAELALLARWHGKDLPMQAYTPGMLVAALAGPIDVERLGTLSFVPLGALAGAPYSVAAFKAVLLARPG